MIEREEGSPGRWGWAARALGGLIALIGLVLAVGGAWLAPVEEIRRREWTRIGDRARAAVAKHVALRRAP